MDYFKRIPAKHKSLLKDSGFEDNLKNVENCIDVNSGVIKEIIGMFNQSINTLCCKCRGSLTCLYCKMPMFHRVGMKEGGGPPPLAFQYLILVI